MIQKQYLLPIGIILFLVGIGLVYYNITGEEWHIGEDLDRFDDTTWVIRDQSIGFATPWSYDLGTLPEGTRIFVRYNVTTVETRPQIARPGLTRHSVIDVGTGEVVDEFDMGSVSVIPWPMCTLPRTSQYKYTVQSIRGGLLPGWTYDNTPVDFHMFIQANRLIITYPYRLVGMPLLIAGIALAAYSKIKK